MKKISLLLAFCLAILTVAQAQIPPQAFNYSAVARNAAGQPIATATIGIQISILKTSALGTVLYSENHFVNTDSFGLFNLIVGAGAVQSGSMNSIQWSTDNFYLKVGMDINGGTSFLTMGTTQLLSVPYAIHAATADSIIGGNLNEIDPLFTASVAAAITAADTTNWNNDIDSTNELQTISRSNDTLFLSNGGFVVLPNATGGKTYIELFGDVTNAQADSILTADLGPNTQFVYITNTTQLTSVNLAGVNGLLELKIMGNEALTSVNASTVTRCTQTMEITYNPVLNSLTMPSLSYLGNLSTFSNNQLSALNFPVLTKVQNFTVSSNNALTTIAAGSLTKANSIKIQYNAGLTSVSFPTLTNLIGLNDLNWSLSLNQNPLLTSLSASMLTNALSIRIEDNGLTSLNLSSLTNLSGDLTITNNTALSSISCGALTSTNNLSIENNGVSSISFPALSNASYIVMSGNSNLLSFTAGALTTANGISIYQNGLTSISLPALSTLNGELSIYENSSLSTLSVGSLTTTQGIQISNNGLTSLNFPSLNSISGNPNPYFNQLNITNNPNLNTLSAGSLTSLGYLNITNNGLTTVSLPALSNLSGNLIVENNSTLTSMALGSLATANAIYFKNNGLTSISLPALTSLNGTINGTVTANVFVNASIIIAGNLSLSSLSASMLSNTQSIVIDNNGLTSLNLSSLTSLSNYLSITNNASLNTLSLGSLATLTEITISNNGLTSINLPSLTSLNDMEIITNPNLSTLNLSSLSNLPNLNLSQNNLSNIIWAPSINGMFDLNAQSNSLPVAEINEILAFAVPILGGQNGCIYIDGQNPPASPSGQGFTDFYTIQNYGGCVYVD
jgi:hypothetical protein